MSKLKIGEKAPSFSGKDQDGKQHNLEDYKGKKLVLFFYPKASTPGCTAEACNLRDSWNQFEENGYKIVGISADSMKRQKNFQEKQNLPFPLLADEDRQIIEAYGVWEPKKFMGKSYNGIHRTTFVIDEEGILEDIIDKVKTKDHASQIL